MERRRPGFDGAEPIWIKAFDEQQHLVLSVDGTVRGWSRRSENSSRCLAAGNEVAELAQDGSFGMCRQRVAAFAEKLKTPSIHSSPS